MSGVRNWHLFDHDALEPVNLVKHPARRSDLGRPKVEIMAEWLRDRNPAATVDAVADDARKAAGFEAAVLASDLVLCAVDDAASRSWINAECVRLGRACLTGSVIRTGLGGEVYLFVPGETGCLSCMQLIAATNGMSLDEALDLTDEERHHRYGLGEEGFTTSGLAIDIALVAAYHAHMAWSALMGGSSPYVPRLPFNWLTVGIRPEQGVFRSHYLTHRALLKPQRSCNDDCARWSRGAAEAS
jgi:hypothetical protein